MDDMPRIEVKNFDIVKVCFRIVGRLWNEGYVVIDRDTFCFAGHLTNDDLVGYYDKDRKMYNIQYAQHEQIMEGPQAFFAKLGLPVIPEEEVYEYVMDIYTEVKNIAHDLVDTEMGTSYGDGNDYKIQFFGVVNSEMEKLKIMSANSDLVQLVE